MSGDLALQCGFEKKSSRLSGGVGTKKWWLGVAFLALACAHCAGPAVRQSTGELRPEDLGLKCVFVAPLMNETNSPSATQEATEMVVNDLQRRRLFAVPSAEAYKEVFSGSGLDIPPDMTPDVALAIAEILGADGVVFGGVEGQWVEDNSEAQTVVLSMQLVRTADGRKIWQGQAAYDPGQTLYLAKGFQAALAQLMEPLGEGEIHAADVKRNCWNKSLRTEIQTAAAKPATIPSSLQDAPPQSAALPKTLVQPAEDEAMIPLVDLEDSDSQVTNQPAKGKKAREYTRAQLNILRRLRASRAVILTGAVVLGEDAVRLNKTRDLGHVLRRNPDLRVSIQVHAGAASDDKTLRSKTQEQADAIKKYFAQAYQVAPDRMEAKGVGASSPVVPNLTLQNRRINTRVEVKRLK